MKKTLLSIIAVFALCLTANAQTDWGTNWSNEFTGKLWVALGDSAIYDDETLVSESEKIYINATGETNKVNFSLPKFTFYGLNVGDIYLPNITLTPNAEGFTFNENDKVQLHLQLGDTPILAEACINDTLSYITIGADGDSLVAYIPVVWIQDETDRNQDAPIWVLFKGKSAVSTSIGEAIARQTIATGIYDLSGRRHATVSSARRPSQIYIVNGKKIFK